MVAMVNGVNSARVALTALAATNTTVAALGTALGPVGLVAAAGLAAFAVVKFAQSIDTAIVPAVEVAEQAIGDLEQTMRELYAAGSTLGPLAERGVDLFPGIVEGTARMEELEDAIAGTNAVIGQMSGDALDEANADLERWNNELFDLAQKYGSLDDQMLASTLSTEEVTAATEAFNSILRETGAGAADQQAALAGLVDLYDSGAIDAESFAESVIALADDTDYYNERATNAAIATEELGGAMSETSLKVLELADALSLSMTLAGRSGGLEGWAEAQEAALDSVDTALARSMTMAGRSGGLEGWSPGLASIQAVMQEFNEVSGTRADAGFATMASGFHGMAAAMAETIPTADELAVKAEELGRVFEGVRSTYTSTTDALDAGFRVIVGNTNAIADSAQGVADWATELIGAEGTYAQIDDLLASGAINLQEYNAAQEAHNSILAANASIQEDVLAIQTKQAPVLAELTEQQAAYMDEVANMPAEQQTLALAYMDTATAMQALELAQVAASEAPGFEGLIQGAIAANPYLEAILTDMGIVSRGAEGELIIHTEGQTEMENLTMAIEALNTTFTTLLVIEVDDSQLQSVMNGGGSTPMSGEALRGERSTGAFNIVMTADNSDVIAKIEDSTSKLDNWASSSGEASVQADSSDATANIATAQRVLGAWDSSTGTANVNAQDNASGTISSVNSALNALNGKTATTYINTVYTTTGTPAGHGGVLSSYALGGVTAEMGEWGDELLRLGGGGMAMTRGRGLYTVPEHTYVTPAPATRQITGNLGGSSVNVYIENLYGDETLAEKVSKEIVPAIERAMTLHQRGY